ncbi:MAG TPA: glycosyltransferase family 39 protein [Solirubrobacteraceae bacterium]
MSATAQPAAPAAARARKAMTSWWPLIGVTLLAAVLRLSTLDLQSFWYDEAFTPVHVLHPSLWATLRSVTHTENTPPLWYVLEWVDSRLLGTGEIALRLPSALAGIATVPVAWAIAHEIEGSPTRRAAIVCAVLVAVNPLFVWYSQEARAYALFVLMGAIAMLCFLRALLEPTAKRMTVFALAGALALLTHYFAVFLLIPMALLLLRNRGTRRAAAPAVGVLALVGIALLPLISAQGGHGTQWIGHWPLSERLQAIPQYYLTGYSGMPLGRGIELLVALPILAALTLGAWRMKMPHPRPQLEVSNVRREGVWIALVIAACGVIIPIVLVGFGADYLAPRNLVAAMVPLTAAIAVISVWPGTGRTGIALAALIAVAFLAISLDVDASPRLQRGNWRDVANALRGGVGGDRNYAITTVELGSAPLEYYLHGLHELHEHSSVLVREIDETGYAPLRASAGEPPAPGFRLKTRLDIDGLIVYRFVSPTARLVSEEALRRHVITLATPNVLVPANSQANFTDVRG